MERIAELMQKFPACCPEDTFGLCTRKRTKCGLLTGWLVYVFYEMCRQSVAGEDLMTVETLILASLCIGAAAGVRLRAFALFPLILLCFVVVTAWGLA